MHAVKLWSFLAIRFLHVVISLAVVSEQDESCFWDEDRCDHQACAPAIMNADDSPLVKIEDIQQFGISIEPALPRHIKIVTSWDDGWHSRKAERPLSKTWKKEINEGTCSDMQKWWGICRKGQMLYHIASSIVKTTLLHMRRV
ncbi:hypothetical protein P154DRAFT_536788 [Amniculicola lignicola CBS 123094]|uniref:Uncharacterized protein n=1 Tax=Amniculicola lignicola CBS 123094 TaxID=1392246 RepID=A0A6A5W7L9_9PLEO|nr:hypothetical protein P154DRAFT_536788 [Amniculicola lignicola CBS 123094]